MPMDTENTVYDLVVSGDGKWIVAGTKTGQVVVWNSTNFEKTNNFKAHDDWVNVVDISVDGTKIATGSRVKMLTVFRPGLLAGLRNTTLSWSWSSSLQTANLLQPPRGSASPLGSTTVWMAPSSQAFQSK